VANRIVEESWQQPVLLIRPSTPEEPSTQVGQVMP